MDATCWKVIAGMGAAVTALAVAIRVLWGAYGRAQAALVACQAARIAQAEEHKKELDTLKRIIIRRRGDYGA